MIRLFRESDMDSVLDIWLRASIKAHDFVEKEFWQSHVKDMREVYIPGSETYVLEDNNQVLGFFSLYEKTLAALFVDPDHQGKGIGTRLMDKAKSLRRKIDLCVYSENTTALGFYVKCGFTVKKERPEPHTGHRETLMEYTGAASLLSQS